MAKILIIEDDPDVIEGATLVLEEAGHTVVSSAEVLETERLMLEEQPDVLILDVMAPENPTAGFETCRDLKRNAAIKHIPVLLLSAINETFKMGFGTRDSITKVAAADRMLEKPLDPDKLIAVVEELTGGGSQVR